MNQFIKKLTMGIGMLGLASVIGCSNPTKGEADYLLCNQTSNGKMAEIETGYFLVWDEFLYYADKENLENWVAVCNKPDCMHNEHYECNASLPGATKIWQKDGNFYEIGINADFKDGPCIHEITSDGSGIKKAYEIPVVQEYFLNNSRGSSQATFGDEFIYNYGYLNEKGIYVNYLIRIKEDENGEVKVDTLYSGEDGVTVMSGNEFWGVRGDNLLINTLVLEEGDMLQDCLCTINENNEFVPFDLPEDVPLASGYLDGDIFTYYKSNEGFYQYHISTGEKELLFENQVENGKGYVLSEDYMIESNRYYKNVPEETQLKVYNGKKWIDVAVPEEVANSKNPFTPVCITSDRMFFRMNVIPQGKSYATGTYLYYMMLEDKNPELLSAGNIGDEMSPSDGEEPSSEGTVEEADVYESFEEVIVFDTEDYLFKITDIYLNASNYACVKLELENRSENKTYTVRGNSWAINGIQSTTLWGQEAAPKEIQTDMVTLREGGGRVLGECRLSEFYNSDEYTNIQMGFHLIEEYKNEEGKHCSKVIEEKFINIYPQGEEKAITFTRAPQDTDIVLVNNENVSVVVTGYEEEFVPNDTVRVFITNKTDNYIQVAVDKAFANGIAFPKEEYEPDLYWVMINPGAVAAYPMTLFNDAREDSFHVDPTDTFFKANGITSIEDIEMNLRIYPCDYVHGETGEDFVNQVVVLKP